MATAAALWVTPAAAVPVSGQGTWETTLLGRDINGNAVAGSDASAVFLYDTILNITWRRDANRVGPMEWGNTVDEAMYLNVGGYTGWRLPTMVDTGTVGCNLSFSGGTDCGYNAQTRSGATVYSEMAILFFEELGNKSYCPPVVPCLGAGQPGWGLTNTGDFQNMQSEHYWSGLEYAPDPGGGAWFFNNRDGSQNRDSKDEALYALFVRPGDVLAAGTVPEPQGVALMLTALAGLVVVRRRRLR